MKSSNYWLEHISKWSQSGISQAEYCRREQISFNSFSYRKLKQGNEASKTEAVKFIDLSPSSTAKIELCGKRSKSPVLAKLD